MLSHQIGGFFGAWLGGLAFSHYGNYLWMWYADALFAMIAALLNLPIREPRVRASRPCRHEVARSMALYVVARQSMI